MGRRRNDGIGHGRLRRRLRVRLVLAGRNLRLERVQNAIVQAKTAAATILG